MATIKLNQITDGAISKLKQGANNNSSAAATVKAAANEISSMDFSSKQSIQNELSKIQKNLNRSSSFATELAGSIQKAQNELISEDKRSNSGSNYGNLNDLFNSSRSRNGSLFAGIYTQNIMATCMLFSSGLIHSNMLLGGKILESIKESLRRLIDHTQKNNGVDKKNDNSSNTTQPSTPTQDNANSHTEKVKKILATADQHVGEKYVSGGDGNGKYDCIGFVREAYRSIGINLKRAGTSNGTPNWADQGVVTNVTGQAGAPAPGDILCWYPNGSNLTGQPSHAAIYTGYIKTDVINGTYNGYKTDSEGYILDKWGARVDYVNALNPKSGVCYCSLKNSKKMGSPKMIMRAP